MRLSTVGECERVNDSVQPVHSWKGSQMTEGRFAFSSDWATADTIDGGRAIIEVMVAQNFMKPRRETPCCSSISPSVCLVAIAATPIPLFAAFNARLRDSAAGVPLPCAAPCARRG